MIEIIDLDKTEGGFSPSVIGLGNFDGIHIGHRQIMDKVIDIAKNKGLISAVLLFKQHSNEVFPHMAKEYLSSLEDKIESLEEIGIERVFLINFTFEFAQLTNEEFVLDFIRDRLNAKSIVCGENYTFGRNGKGTIRELYEYHEKKLIDVNIVEFKYFHKEIASSTIVRSLVRSGKIEEAFEILKKPYSVRGLVDHGFKRGSKELGFPTANLEFNFPYIIPEDGVYITRAIIEDKGYYSLTSIGTNPTFTDSKEVKFEVYIIDFNDNIYGRQVKVEFLKRLRGQIKFKSGEDLIDQMNKDLERAYKYIKNHG